MKKILPLSLIVLASCTSIKPLPDNSQALVGHTAPFRIYGIGGYSKYVSVLTLVDAQNHYFTLMAARDTTLKVGGTYHP